MNNGWKPKLAIFGIVFLASTLPLSLSLAAEEKCPVEFKLLLSPPAIQNVIASLGFGKPTASRVYFFDTKALDLLKQGAIVRVRQGTKNGNDLTVKVRLPEDDKEDHDNYRASHLQERFPCEIDRTGAGVDSSFSVGRPYTAEKIPRMGSDISSALNPEQEKLLKDARISIDWAQVTRIADIKLTKWESTSQLSGKLTLELWEWPSGSILELSAKAGSEAGAQKYDELVRLVSTKGLPLNDRQGTKTNIALEAIAH